MKIHNEFSSSKNKELCLLTYYLFPFNIILSTQFNL